MDKPLISVIIPVYKTEKYLKTCVDSVCLSDYKNLQIILVDDGSPDNCPELCDNIAKTDERIKVIHKENGGLSSARNAALDIMTGQYVTFIDSDDVIKPDMISSMYDIAHKEKCDIVKIGMVLTEDENEKGISESGYTVASEKEALGRIYTDPPSIVTICGKLYKSSLFDDERFPEGIINEDEYLTPRLFHKCRKIALCEKTGYLYMQRPGESIMRSNFSLKKMDILEIIEDRTKLFESWGYKDLAKLSERDNFVHLLILRGKTKNTEYKEQYDLIMKKINRVRFSALSFGQKLRFIFLKINLYDIVYK